MSAKLSRNIVGVISMALSCLCLGVRASSLVDTSFNPGSGTGGALGETVIEQPDGKILLSGNFTQFNGTPHAYLVRLNNDGSVDSTFNAQPSYWVRTMALQPDGKIVIGGYFNYVSGQPRNTIARLNSDGSLDTSFNPGTGAWGSLGTGIDGKTNEYIFATAVQPDGKILITGNFTNYNGTAINGLARLNSNGSLDTTFNVGDGLNMNSWGRSLTLLSGGRFIVTGWFNHYNHADHSRMAIVNSDGSADGSFAPNFGDQTAVYSAIPLPGGKYLVSGHSENIHHIFQQDIARLNADGSFDTSFVGTSSDKTEMVRLQSDGKILMCGYFTQVDNQQKTSVARLNPDGSLDTSFGANFDNFAWSMFIEPNGNILVAGGFGNVDGYSRAGIVRLYPTPQPEDKIPPSLVVKTPGENLNRIASDALTMSGTATDSNGVARVSVTINGQSADVTGTTDFSATGTLLPGTNVVVFSATDTAGNQASLTRYLYHPGKTPMVVTTDGNGTVTPNLNNSMLEAGSHYTVTAVPKNGYVFAGWTGIVTTNSPKVTFTMDRGATLQASFAPNPFTEPAGVYRGLVLAPDSPAAATAGTVSITVQNNGSYTSRLMWGGRTYSFTGRFDLSMASSAMVPRGRNQAPLNVNLQITDSQTIQGTVTVGDTTSSLTANKTVYDGRHQATNFAGLYTALLPGNSGTGAPSGYGYFTISVKSSGSVVVSGALADGTPTVQVAPLGANGSVPLYFQSAMGVAFGWLTLTPNDSGDSDVQGSIHWEKSSRGQLLFSENITLVGSVYHAPHAGTPVLGLADAALQADGGGLSDVLSDTFTLDTRNRVTFSSPNSDKFTLTFQTSTGRFSGRFTDPSTRHPGFYQGVVLQKQNIGGGFFSSNRQTGRVFFGGSGATAP